MGLGRWGLWPMKQRGDEREREREREREKEKEK